MTTQGVLGEQAGFGRRVMTAVLWRSGSQFVAQLVTWSATFFVIRLLTPADYGLIAMTQSVLVFMNLLCGYGLASALVRSEMVSREQVAQVFGMLLILNGGIALLQVALAPLAAVYFRQPMVADLLRVQALIYLATPFIALPSALLAREMDFRREAQVNLAAAIVGAAVALGCAAGGMGVWTLVAAPVALFWTRAIGMTVATGGLVRPSFDFHGMRGFLAFGGAMTLSQLLWLVQTQSDVAIGGRVLGAHDLGLYTTALFLAQIVTAKFIPPLNDVAYSAYARLQGDRAAVTRGFERAVRVVMLVAAPFCLGLAAAAEPLVLTVLGRKWAEAAPLVALVALAMPAMALQILFAPAATALGRPRVQVLSSAAGAVIMPAAFLAGIGGGGDALGLAWAWVGAAPLLLLTTARLAMPVIGIGGAALVRAVAPGLAAATAMAGLVTAADHLLAFGEPGVRLAVLVAIGGATYAALTLCFARAAVIEAVRLVLRR